MKSTEQPTKKSQKNLYLKIGFIVILLLLLMIPNLMIQGLILERQSMDQEVKREIASHWGPNQNLIGPILSIPFTKEVKFDKKKTLVRKVLRIVPNKVDINVDIQTEERKKGIYKAILYNADHQLSGNFTIPEVSEFGNDVKEVLWNEAVVDLGFTSAASLDDIVYLNWDNKKIKMKSGSSSASLFHSGIHSKVNIDSLQNQYDFSTIIGLNGSESIHYLPIANNTTLNIKSDWDSPGFVGLPLPQTRDITADGFTAEWKATEYNRPFKNKWFDSEVKIANSNSFFGVELVQTVGHYQKNMRSAKYALMILGMSFMVFFFFEILKGYKIHPVQYIFIGLALSIFYILLLSFSEHVGFNHAYGIASVATTGLISWYGKFLLKKEGSTLILTLILIVLYAYIFTLLQMEDMALLVGSIGLFMALFITMYLSRNTDWHTLGLNKMSLQVER